MKPGRNDPCPCGSGKKYKQCCGSAQAQQAGASTTSAAQPAGAAPSVIEQNQLIALYQARRFADLEIQAKQMTQRYPQSGFAWKILSAALTGQSKDEFDALQQAAILLPQDAQVHNNYGDLLAKREQLQKAEHWFRSAIRINPQYADAHYNLGQVLMRQEQYQEAGQSLNRSLELQPDNVEAVLNLGVILRQIGLIDESLAKLRLAQKMAPDSVEVNHQLGGGLAEQGKFDEAEVYCRRALAFRSEFVPALATLVAHKKIRQDAPEFVLLRQIHERGMANGRLLTVEEQIQLNFVLGKSFNDVKDYDQAFGYFATGCRLKRGTFQYDPAETERVFEQIQRALSRESIARLSGGGDADATPIFVLGMPRSGTTLTEQIIASHPDVYGAGELNHVAAIARQPIAGQPFPANLFQLDAPHLAAWGKAYLAALKRHAPEAKRITDKMPQNFERLGLIHLMLPKAKIVHIKRNPVDTCLSGFTMNFVGKNLKYSYDLSELGRFYVAYDKLMAHWREVLPAGAFLEVQYEDLIQDTEAQTRRLIEYCGLEWNEACLAPHKSERSVRTASVVQVRNPVYATSVERWRRYERHLGPLLDALGDLVPNR